MTRMAANTSLNMLWDHRPGQNRFAGIVLQEYSPREQKLIGQRRLIFRGTSIGFTEAPHLYKRGGYYHLLVAEGGTSWGHAVTMARSRNDRRALRTASRHLCPDGARSARLRLAACRSWLTRGNARRRNLHGLSVRQAAAQSRTLCPGPGDGDPEDGLVAGWVAPHGRRRRRAAGERAGAEPAVASVSRAALDARISIRRSCPSIFSGCARPIPSGSGALPSGPDSCASSAEKPWGASSSRRWSLAGSKPIASRPRRAWSSSPSIFNRRPA